MRFFSHFLLTEKCHVHLSSPTLMQASLTARDTFPTPQSSPSQPICIFLQGGDCQDATVYLIQSIFGRQRIETEGLYQAYIYFFSFNLEIQSKTVYHFSLLLLSYLFCWCSSSNTYPYLCNTLLSKRPWLQIIPFLAIINSSLYLFLTQETGLEIFSQDSPFLLPICEGDYGVLKKGPVQQA